MPEPSPAHLQLRDANLLDPSHSGVLVEHTHPVWRGGIYCLSFPGEGLQVRLLARATHAPARQRIAVSGQEGQVVFPTGMEFMAIGKCAAELISAYVDRAWQQGPAG